MHLSEDVSTAEEVGKRLGNPVIPKIEAGSIHTSGHVFSQAANGVWLADYVLDKYVGFP